jgi:DNA-binding Xre family transcriptional regulator
MPRSLRVASQHIERVKAALLRNGFPRQQDLADALEISRDRVNGFLNGKPVGFLNFTEICRVLALEWKDVADFGTQECESSQSSARAPVQ